MPFAYYSRLGAAERRIYRQSDAVTAIPLPGAHALRPLVAQLAEALASGSRPGTEASAEHLLAGLCAALGVAPVRVQVLAARPARDWGELHGLYTPAEGGRRARVSLWMRTARRRQVVAFRTFLRTALHECCHHLDYVLLHLPDSFHTEGFYKRESSLFHRLMGEERGAESRPGAGSRWPDPGGPTMRGGRGGRAEREGRRGRLEVAASAGRAAPSEGGGDG